MHDLDLFQRALGLEEPWEVVDVKFDAWARRLDLRIDFPKGVSVCLPGVRCGRMQGARHRAAHVAASELLSA